jgi:hypothetical protein
MIKMSDSVQKYYMDNSYLGVSKDSKELNENVSEDVINILDLFRLLSAENKIKIRQMLRDEKIF